MTRTQVARRIHKLLDAIKADFPRRKKAAEELMRRAGIRESLELEIFPAELVSVVPTFDVKISRPFSPMLKARFDYAGSWKTGQDIWLSAAEMPSYLRRRAVRSYHRALREHWEGSAPMTLADRCLALFGVTEGVPEDLIYLAWRKGEKEPEVWVYEGMESHNFKNLEEYFTWCLEAR